MFACRSRSQLRFVWRNISQMTSMPVSCCGGRWTLISSLTLVFSSELALLAGFDDKRDSSFGQEIMLRLFWFSLMIKNIAWMQLKLSNYTFASRSVLPWIFYSNSSQTTLVSIQFFSFRTILKNLKKSSRSDSRTKSYVKMSHMLCSQDLFSCSAPSQVSKLNRIAFNRASIFCAWLNPSSNNSASYNYCSTDAY